MGYAVQQKVINTDRNEEKIYNDAKRFEIEIFKKRLH